MICLSASRVASQLANPPTLVRCEYSPVLFSSPRNTNLNTFVARTSVYILIFIKFVDAFTLFQYCVRMLCWITRCDFENFIFTTDSFPMNPILNESTFISLHVNGISKKRAKNLMFGISLKAVVHKLAAMMMVRSDSLKLKCGCKCLDEEMCFFFLCVFSFCTHTSKVIQIKESAIDSEHFVPGTNELPTETCPSVCQANFIPIIKLKPPVWAFFLLISKTLPWKYIQQMQADILVPKTNYQFIMRTHSPFKLP